MFFVNDKKLPKNTTIVLKQEVYKELMVLKHRLEEKGGRNMSYSDVVYALLVQVSEQ